MTMTQNDLFSCCQAKTILTHEPVAAPRKKKIPKRRSLCNCFETYYLQSYFRHFSEDTPNKFHPKFAFSKTMLYLCRRKPASQQNIQASLIFCIRFAFSLQRQPMKVLREPRRGHLLRPRSVTIDDQRRSSIKTPKEHYSKADRRHRATNKTPDTRAVTNAPTIS